MIWPLCTASIRPGTASAISHIDSHRAGGRYRLTIQAAMSLQSLQEEVRARLTTLLIEQRRQGNPEPDVTQSLIDGALNKPPLEVAERADRLLRYLVQCSNQIGHNLRFDLSNGSESTLSYGALAWSESTTPQEVHYLLRYLTKQDWITEPGADVFSVSVDGHGRVSDLNTNPDSAQAFVAMWFGEEMDSVYENGIKPAIELAGYTPMRIDKKDDVVKIDDEIVTEIRRSRFLVADSTHGDDGARGGVYFEAGFAFGIGIPVIYTCRDDVVEKIHFDTRQYHHTIWKSAEDLREGLKNRIIALMGEGPNVGGSAIIRTE